MHATEKRVRLAQALLKLFKYYLVYQFIDFVHIRKNHPGETLHGVEECPIIWQCLRTWRVMAAVYLVDEGLELAVEIGVSGGIDDARIGTFRRPGQMFHH